MAVNHLLISLIFLLTFKTVLFAEIQPENLTVHAGNLFKFVQKEELPEFLQLTWEKKTFSRNHTKNIATYYNKTKSFEPDSSYENRVELSTTDFTLTLKKMQKMDSGLYCTTTVGIRTLSVCQYSVSVVDNHGSPTTTFLPWLLFTSTLSTIMF
ncbi:hypothetical protein QQF64_015552 [Cirrhinus molitorella]|uniref:Natural killer cell receptor 2B4 immunoglobulin domain-containing protein n=1 Tax=Cirrhinus molitorella TaxID=172907 RepID=A0ABR3NV86_9TELE